VLDGIAVTSIEGIGNMRTGLHPVQQRIAAMHGSQCGFCTPGIVMAIYTHLRAHPDSTPHQIEESLDGNLCRCTGYRPIIDAARSLSHNKDNKDKKEKDNKDAPKSQGCCKGSGGGGGCPCAEVLKAPDTAADSFVHSSSETSLHSWMSMKEELNSRSLSEPIFPPLLTHYERKSLRIVHKDCTWYQPLTLAALHSIKCALPDARLVVGNTEVGIEMKYKALEYKNFINPSYVEELQVCRTVEAVEAVEAVAVAVVEGTGTGDSHPAPSARPAGIEVGAAVTINHLRDFIESLEAAAQQAQTQAQTQTYAPYVYQLRGLTAIRNMLSWFASNHIRNVACVGGNIATASPISDLNPMLIACKGVLKLSSVSGVRYVAMDKFFLSYRKVDLAPHEVLESVFIPFTSEFEFVLPFKQARRREDDISIVTAGMRVCLAPSASPSGGGSEASGPPEEGGSGGLGVSGGSGGSGGSGSWVVSNCTLAFGGMAPTTIEAKQTSAALTGLSWDASNIGGLFPTMRRDLSLPAGVPGGQSEYRMSLAVSFFFKAYLTITVELATFLASALSTQHSPTFKDLGFLPPAPQIDPSELSGAFNFLTSEKVYSRGEQGYFTRTGGIHKALTADPSVPLVPPVPPAIAPPPVSVPVPVPVVDPGAVGAVGAVGKPLMHRSAESQVSGEATFTDDLNLPSNALHACLVTSTKAHARLVSVDISEAQLCPGFVAYFCAKDVVGSNKIGAVIKDEEVFVTEIVTHVGAVRYIHHKS
jgi:xanthine dehydrogenase/oxidase